MLISSVPALNKRKEADLIALPFWEGVKKAKAATHLHEFTDHANDPVETKDFLGKKGELSSLIYVQNGLEKRAILVGLGKEEELTVDSLRTSYASLTRFCLKKEIKNLNLLLPNIVELRGIEVKEALRGIAEGILLSNYKWFLGSSEQEHLLSSVTFIGVLQKLMDKIDKWEILAKGVYLARDLINGNADDITPEFLANTACEISKKHPEIKVELFDEARIHKENLGLIEAVSRGAAKEPRLIFASYKGAPRSKDHTILIGKGVTFDTGGLNLKPTGSMETMRDDMSGGATVLATLQSVAALGLKCNVTAVVPATENAIGSMSFKPGDVFRSYSGKTVEVNNTDAEGRLILADAISYCVKHLKPTRIIDLATLTGSMVIALGESIAGVMSNNDQLADQLIDAGVITAEPLWRMPLYLPYKELLKSDIADLKNTGGRPGGSITAALFLHEFVGDVPWAHIDIAGTAFLAKEKGYWPKNAVGFGVRLLVQFLEDISHH